MTIATQRLSFEEYLKYADGTDRRYELVAGELIPMSLGSGLHGEITHGLETRFNQEIQRLGWLWVARKGIIGIHSPQGGRWETSRIPDVTVLPKEQWRGLRQKEAVIRLNEPPPILVVEVVSESTKGVDYRAKRSEYSVLGIAEYWIVDPLKAEVTICTLLEGFYDTAVFRGEEVIQSPTFVELAVTAEQVLAGEE